MRIILLSIVLLFHTASFSQIITDTTLIQGRLISSYFIFDIPKNPEGNNLKLLNSGDFVYIVGVITTTRNPPQDLWYHCFYRNIEGYLPISKVEVYGNWSTEKMSYLNSNKDKSFEERLSISRKVSTREGFIADSIEKRNQEMISTITTQIDSVEKEIIKKLAQRAKREKLLLISYSYPVNILGYPGFKVRFINGADKSIKYATFKIVAYNPVNDIEGTKEVKCIGKVEPFNNAEYNFEDVFISKVTDHYTIPTVRIQYMDNSIVTLSGNQLLINYEYSQIEKMTELKDFETILIDVFLSYLKLPLL